VVAILAKGGGAIVETHAVLGLNEGRGETYSRGGATGSLSYLSYGLTFWPKSDEFGDQHTGYEAQIVINGTAANGRPMEIRGDGFIGHDEHGKLDGKFYDAPLMLIPSEDDLKQHIESQSDRFDGSVWAPMGDFIWATYGRLINKDDL
jgi:hypothetical protein